MGVGSVGIEWGGGGGGGGEVPKILGTAAPRMIRGKNFAPKVFTWYKANTIVKSILLMS